VCSRACSCAAHDRASLVQLDDLRYASSIRATTHRRGTRQVDRDASRRTLPARASSPWRALPRRPARRARRIWRDVARARTSVAITGAPPSSASMISAAERLTAR
jgi:hypothetical protein